MTVNLAEARRILGSKNECSGAANRIGTELILEVEKLRAELKMAEEELDIMREWLKK